MVSGLGSALLWAPRLAPSRKKPAMKLPPALTLPPRMSPQTIFTARFHSVLGASLSEERHLNWGSFVSVCVALSPLKAVPGAQLKPRAYPLSTPAQECLASNRLHMLVGVSAMQFLLKIQKNLH